eukprot:scaffold31886_cov66-Attheya_sp.AAC.14
MKLYLAYCTPEQRNEYMSGLHASKMRRLARESEEQAVQQTQPAAAFVSPSAERNDSSLLAAGPTSSITILVLSLHHALSMLVTSVIIVHLTVTPAVTPAVTVVKVVLAVELLHSHYRRRPINVKQAVKLDLV